MKIILDNENNETIHIDEVTNQHLVVGIINNEPCILSKGHTETNEYLKFSILCRNFTSGNGYDFSKAKNTTKKMIEYAISCNYRIEVFNQNDWKKALQWLIDNAK